jgi:hypothetical protein
MSTPNAPTNLPTTSPERISDVQKTVIDDLNTLKNTALQEFEKNKLANAVGQALKELKQNNTVPLLNKLYTEEFKNVITNVSKNTPEKLREIESIKNKLKDQLAKKVENMPEQERPGWAKKQLYKLIDIDWENLSNNSTGKNIFKGVLDELAAIPEFFADLLWPPYKIPANLWNFIKAL